MTTNQTIDGVPRELLASFAAYVQDSPNAVMRAKVKELRALLDAPAEPKPTGLSQGWNLTRKQDGFVVGHQSMAFPPDEKAIERAERGGYVWVPFLLPATQHQGEPVAWIKPDVAKTLTKDECCYAFGGQNPKGTLIPLYAEQPAPVAVVPARPRADEEEYERMTDYEKGLLHGGIELWDKIDELKRLNPSL